MTTCTINRIYGNNEDDLVAYTAMDDSLSDSDEREYTLCSATILLYTSDFTRYSWANTINDRCNLLKNEYNTTAPKTIYVHRDQLNNTVALTDQSGAIVQQYSYDVYGKPYILIGTGMVSMDEYTNNPMYTGNMHGNTRLFTGREYDGETGLYYFRARMYSANLGRFMNRDPIGMGDSVNLYMYVGDNPMGGRDPSGRFSWSIFSWSSLVKNNIISGWAILRISLPIAFLYTLSQQTYSSNGVVNTPSWFDVGNSDSVRIIYEHWPVGHMHLQVGNQVYTYETPNGNWGLWIASVFTDVKGEMSSMSIESFLLTSPINGSEITTYDIKTDKSLIENRVQSLQENPWMYGLFGSNCSSMVGVILGDKAIPLPILYGIRLDVKRPNVSKEQTFTVPTIGSDDWKVLQNNIDNAYGNTVDTSIRAPNGDPRSFLQKIGAYITNNF